MEVSENFRVDIGFKTILNIYKGVFLLKLSHKISEVEKYEILFNDEKMIYKLLWADFEKGKIHSDSTGLPKIKAMLLFSFLYLP